MKLLLAFLFSAKLLKVALSGGTMLLSIFVYAGIYGWKYALGFVLLIFVHEFGHLLAARNRGLEVGAPVFIPFVGAWISLKQVHLDPETEAFVGLGGPVLGSAGAFVCYMIAQENGERLWLAIAYAGFFLNLFNLIPIRPLDGGRVVRAVSTKLWFIGLPLLIAVYVWQQSPLVLVLAILALPDILGALRGTQPEAAHSLAVGARIKYGAMYLLLACGLAVLAYSAHEQLHGGA